MTTLGGPSVKNPYIQSTVPNFRQTLLQVELADSLFLMGVICYLVKDSVVLMEKELL